MAFCVPGESYLEVLDAFHDAHEGIRLINARHEAGAANMAEAYGKLTGRPGICLVTRGPGACQAAVGVHTAFQDSTPMILFVGQVGRDATDREAFQEVDYRQMFGPVAKWAAQIDLTSRIPEYVAARFTPRPQAGPGLWFLPSLRTCSARRRRFPTRCRHRGRSRRSHRTSWPVPAPCSRRPRGRSCL